MGRKLWPSVRFISIMISAILANACGPAGWNRRNYIAVRNGMVNPSRQLWAYLLSHFWTTIRRIHHPVSPSSRLPKADWVQAESCFNRRRKVGFHLVYPKAPILCCARSSDNTVFSTEHILSSISRKKRALYFVSSSILFWSFSYTIYKQLGLGLT